MYKVRTTNPYIFMNSIKENKNPQFENFSKNELIEMLNILSEEYRNSQQRINKTLDLIKKDGLTLIEIDNEKGSVTIKFDVIYKKLKGDNNEKN